MPIRLEKGLYSAGNYNEYICINIKEYKKYCYLVFCYCNKNIIIDKTSEMTYI